MSIPDTASPSKFLAFLRALLSAEAKDPAVHGALRAVQAAVVSVAVVAFKAYFGL